MKDFTIEKRTYIYVVTPNFLNAPDFQKNSRYEIIDQEYFTSLIDSIKTKILKEIVDKKITSPKSRIKICFDKTGKIIYGFFELDCIDKPGEKLTEKHLREIMDAFTNLKIDMSKIETDFDPDKKFQFGILSISLKTK